MSFSWRSRRRFTCLWQAGKWPALLWACQIGDGGSPPAGGSKSRPYEGIFTPKQKKPGYLSSGSPAVLSSRSGPVVFRPPIPRRSAFSDQGDNPSIVTKLWHAANLPGRSSLDICKQSSTGLIRDFSLLCRTSKNAHYGKGVRAGNLKTGACMLAFEWIGMKRSCLRTLDIHCKVNAALSA